VQPAAENVIPATLIPGDGIGSEIVESTVRVLEALGASFAWEVHKAGMAGVDEFDDPLPQPTLDSIRRTRLALKGPLTTPLGGGYRSSNVRLREAFNLYANIRPARTLIPGERYENIDLVLVRENTEGLYVGFEHYIPIGDDPHAVAIGSGVNTRAGCRRIAEYAFEYAVNNGRKKVTVVHKANILKALTAVGFDAEDVPASQALRTFLRELLARVDAVLEVTLFRQSLAERNARLR
jgi:isocitrate dehydrogenase (NAD+)